MPTVHILPDGKTVEVPAGTSLLDASRKAGAMHGSACGGACACSTCHVWVTKGLSSLSEASDRELDILDRAFEVKPSSRLGCQAEVGDEDVELVITPESLQTWLEEHPNERREIESGRLPKGVSDELRAVLVEKLVRAGR
jgi:2Fe-2S ferredoxin